MKFFCKGSFVFLFVFFFHTNLFASYEAFRFWDSQASVPEALQSYPQRRLFSPDLATVLAISNDELSASVDNIVNRESEVALKSSYSGKGYFRVYLWPQGEVESPYDLSANVLAPTISQYKKFHKAPLAILLSGIFSEMSRGELFLTKRIKFFHDQGYHVLVLPILGGANALQDHSRVLPFHFREEAQLELELLHNSIELLGKDRVESVHLLGLSYGSFVAAAMTALDSESSEPMIQSATSLAPVFSAEESLRIIDQGIIGQKESYQNECSNILLHALDYLSMIGPKEEANVSPFVVNCAKTLVAYSGFQSELQRYLSNAYAEKDFYQTLLRFDVAPGPKQALQNLTDITYNEYTQHIDPTLQASSNAAIDRSKGEQFFTYWVGLAKKHGPNKIRVLTTDDEIINKNPDWFGNRYYKFTKNKDFYSVPWGGHGGFAYESEWFAKLLSVAFPKYNVQKQEFENTP